MPLLLVLLLLLVPLQRGQHVPHKELVRGRLEGDVGVAGHGDVSEALQEVGKLEARMRVADRLLRDDLREEVVRIRLAVLEAAAP